MRESPRRVLFIDSCIGLAGGQYSLIEILKTLDPSRFTAMVASPAGSGLRQRCEALGTEWFEIPFHSAHLSCETETSPGGSIRDIRCSLAGILSLAVLMRREKVDLVHANGFKAALVASLAALAVRRPLVFHDRILLRHWPLGNLVAFLSTRIMAISESVAAKYGGSARNKVVLIPPGVDVHRFAPVKREGKSARVCFAGRLTPEKGIERLLEAAAIVVRQVPGARFVIAGTPFTSEDEIYLEGLKLLTAQLGLQDSVSFPGYVEDMKDLIAGCEAVVLPSRREGLGRVVLEAMAMGKAVVAFATGGLREIIKDGETGLLVAPGDGGALAGAIVRVLTEMDLAERLGANGRRLVVAGYSSDAVTARMMAVYDEILERKA